MYPVINPEEEEFNRWLSQQTMSGRIGGGNRLADLAQPQAMNTIRSSSGNVVDLNFAAKGGSGIRPDGSSVSYDPTVDGPRELARYQLPNGTFEVIKEVPVLDGFGRQSSRMIKEIETPAYLNPAALKNVEYQTKLAQLQKIQAEAAAIRNPATTQIPKLKSGERWNAEQQRVESVPGSSEYIKQSGQHAKDYAAQKTTEQKMDFAIDRVNELLDPNNKAMIERNFGGYNAYISQFLPGAGLQGKNKVEALKSTLKNAGLEMMRTGGSIGQMTEREWPIVERMIANINPSLSEDDAITELGKIGQFMKNIKDRAQETYQTEWGNTQFYKDKKAPEQPPMKSNPNLSAQDMQAIDWAMKNRSDPRAQQIMQRLGVR